MKRVDKWSSYLNLIHNRDIEEHQGELKELKRQKEKAEAEYNDAVSAREKLRAQHKRIDEELHQIRADLAKIKKRKTT